MYSSLRGRPAGMPSMMTGRAFPWDSPAGGPRAPPPAEVAADPLVRDGVPVDVGGPRAVDDGAEDAGLARGPGPGTESRVHVDLGAGQAQVGDVVEDHVGQLAGELHPLVKRATDLPSLGALSGVLALGAATDASEVGPRLHQLHGLDAVPEGGRHTLGHPLRAPALHLGLQHLTDGAHVARFRQATPVALGPRLLDDGVRDQHDDDGDDEEPPLHDYPPPTF